MKPKTFVLLILSIAIGVSNTAGQTHDDELTLELIMSDPDWLGRAPQRPYWADDSESAYYLQKREGSRLQDLFRIDFDGEVEHVDHEQMGAADSNNGDLSRDYRFKVYEREGDLYLKDLARGEIRQLTRTAGRESSPRFLLGDREIVFERGDTVLVRNLASGLEYQPADLRTADDPEDEKEKSDYLADQQERLFDIVRLNEERKEERETEERAEQSADPTRTPLPFYLGKGNNIRQASLSPNGQQMLVVLNVEKPERGKRDSMPNYVTASGYVESREVRPKVGTGKPKSDRVMLLDLETHETTELDLSVLPEISRDPLADIRAKAEGNDEKADKGEEPQPRVVSVFGIDWNDDGSQVGFQVHSADSKDRWIATVDLTGGTVASQHHLFDPGWINWRYNEFGWLRDNETLWLLSEETGYSHLYLVTPGEPARALTGGEFEVSSPVVSRDGHFIYYLSNELHPGRYEVNRLDLRSGNSERLTDLGGLNRFVLSPDEQTLLITHSTTTRPPELWIQPAAAGAEAKQLTSTTSEGFLARTWIEPEIIAVPSSHHDRPIYSRLYDAVGPTPLEGSDKRPAVVFIHGAGYLQNSHMGWSGYFREYMFHNLLARRGYVVLDMDYRASAGYGRDWRTAIYRQMGWPEVEDLSDGVDWLVENRNVDRERIGVYGGSYGGFLTFMAMFNEPDLFAAGASLRPVTDWAHYNHGYTSNILNIPDVDPEAYARSSPIEFAEGLEKPLLIAHGMQDDNVFFQDSVRLVQRLIELGKEDWELAVYPIEPHGFREPSSWLDEYRRIFKLFRENLE
jgi:dipeptidyl aminopeptidase/acylaminoacyl peptidase